MWKGRESLPKLQNVTLDQGSGKQKIWNNKSQKHIFETKWKIGKLLLFVRQYVYCKKGGSRKMWDWNCRFKTFTKTKIQNVTFLQSITPKYNKIDFASMSEQKHIFKANSVIGKLLRFTKAMCIFDITF